MVEATLRELGYRVKRNDPFKGVELVRRHGNPAARRHSLQIEINRALYMNEATLQKLPGFKGVQDDISVLIERICGYAEARV